MVSFSLPLVDRTYIEKVGVAGDASKSHLPEKNET